MKRVSLTYFFCALIVSVQSCLAAGAFAAQKSYLIGFSQDDLANDWRRAQVMDVARELKRHPSVTFTYTDGQGETAKQISDIEELVAQGIDLLITSPRDQLAFVPVLKKVTDQGIPVVLLTRRIKNGHFSIYIHPDDTLIARQAARFMAERLQGKGQIFILQGIPTTTTAIARTEGFLAEIARYEGLEVIAMETANYLRIDAVRVTEEIVAKGITFDAIYAQSDSMAVGARLVLENAGIEPETLVIVGIDYIREARQAIREGQQAGSFLYPTCGKEGAQYALKILQGERVPEEVVVPSLLVTRDNVEDIEPIF